MKKYYPLLIVSPLIVVLDQISKYWIVKRLPVGKTITVLKNFFDLGHIKNRGAAFGMLADWNSDARTWFFYLISAAALTALVILYVKTLPTQRKMQIPLAMILGGAIGNLIDRVFYGEVVDFLVVHWYNKVADFTLLGKNFRFLLTWPAFNIADTAITCGALSLIVIVLFFEKKDTKPITHK